MPIINNNNSIITVRSVCLKPKGRLDVAPKNIRNWGLTNLTQSDIQRHC
jgi:hypothetical protein